MSRQPEQWISVSGSNNNIAAGTGSRAGNTVGSGSAGEVDVAALLQQIRALTAALPDREASAQAQAATAAIESDLSKPPEHRFSLNSALAALRALAESVPSLTVLVDALTRAFR